MRTRASILAVIIAVAAACSSGAHPSAAPASSRPVTTPDTTVGLVQGTIDGNAAGVVLATGAAGERFSTGTGAHGRFVLRVPAGRYTVAGRRLPLASGGQMDCTAPGPVIVDPGSTTSIHLTCARA